MKSVSFYLLLGLMLLGSTPSLYSQDGDSLLIRAMFSEVLTKGECYQNLDELANGIGGRLSGSPEAAKAVEWGKKKMEAAGLDKVWLQEVMVPHWVRGDKEVGKILQSSEKEVSVPICALGGSVATGPKGITAEVVEVMGLEEVMELGEEKIKGKIVFFNRPMDPEHIHTFHAYGGCVDQRTAGAKEAAKFGAVASITRSVTLNQDDFPHTGAMRYEEGIPKIPSVAISTNGADLLSKTLKSDPNTKFFIRNTSETLPDVKSYNVIGEITGSEFPDEIILVGGHMDSWDLGDGAHDDGAGIVQSLEALRLFKALDIKPKRTLRVVFYINEENGLKGGIKYAEVAKEEGENHIVAIESDAGGFTPRGFSINGSDEQVEYIQKWKNLLAPYGLNDINKGWGGADISTLKDHGTILIAYLPDSQRYFDYHHCADDTFDKVNKRELELGAASMSSLIWLFSQYGTQGKPDLLIPPTSEK